MIKMHCIDNVRIYNIAFLKYMIQFGFILFAGVRDDRTVSGTRQLNGSAGSQVTENNVNLKSTAENGDEILKHSNGDNANFSNRNRTHVSAKNSLALDGLGVPHSLADDADCTGGESKENSKNLRTKQTVNNKKGCKLKDEVNGLNDNGRDVLCDENNAKESSAKALAFDERPKKDNVLDYACRPGSTGLMNLVNMCYINSIVQCLSSVVELRKYLLCEYMFINGANLYVSQKNMRCVG